MKRSTRPCPTCGKKRFTITHKGQVYCSVRCGRRSAKYVGRLCWTAAEDQILRSRYPDESTAAIAKDLNRHLQNVYQHAAKLGLVKSDAYLASPAACRLRRGDNVGAAHRFKKGQTPANKGLRRPGWHSGRMKETQFKKGQAGTRTMPVGATREIEGYVYRKVSAVRHVPHTVNWKLEHHLIWTREHGPIPKGYAVAFKNGNKKDIRIDNLELVSRSEVMRRNTVHNLPKPIAQTIQLIGALNRQIRRKAKDATEKQDRRSA